MTFLFCRNGAKNSPITWRPSVAACCDVASFVLQLSKVLSGYSPKEEWLDALRKRDQMTEEKTRSMTETASHEHLNPIKVLLTLEEIVSQDSVLVADGGDFVGTAAYTLRPRGPLTWLDPGAFGTLGVGAGFALGAKLCRPESDVWIIYGDGASGYSLVEYDTFKRHELPVICLIGNDASWMQICRTQVPAFGTSIGCQLKYSNYEKVADAFGGKGILLSQEDDCKIVDVLKEAVKEYKSGNSVIINALISKSEFREGSIAV